MGNVPNSLLWFILLSREPQMEIVKLNRDSWNYLNELPVCCCLESSAIILLLELTHDYRILKISANVRTEVSLPSH